MSWTISVPHRHADEAIADVLHHCGRHLPDEEAAVMRRLITEAALDGADTAGDVLSRLESATPEERRGMLDRARAECGLPALATVEARERVGVLKTGGPPLQRCAHPECSNIPANELGMPTEVDARKWWCPSHRHLAQGDDMQPHGSGLRYSESGAIVPIDPAAEMAERSRAESESRRREAEAESRAVEADAVAEHERAREEQLQRELPPHLRRVSA